jgi:hypothetical protein
MQGIISIHECILAWMVDRHSTAWRTKPSTHRIAQSPSGLGPPYQLR